MTRHPDLNASPQDDAAYDLIVVGSGAGGLSAAVTAAHLGLRVAVLEKEPVLGGTTAWSGGWLWVPRNPLATEAGINEPVSAPMQYLESIMGNRAKDPRIAKFLEVGPEMVGFFRDKTAVDWIDGNEVPDFVDVPGAAEGGRSVCAAPYDGRKLRGWIRKLRPPLNVISLAGMGIAAGADMRHFFNATRNLSSGVHVSKRLARHAWDLLRHRRSMQLVNGNALAARLVRSALDHQVALFTDCPVQSLIIEGARISGVVLASGVRLRARSGVVLATGGFPHDKALQSRLFGPETGPDHNSAAPAANTGDGIKMGETAGGHIETDFANGGAWAPISRVPLGDGRYANFPHLIERAKPGIIAVRGTGVRFVNEADSYHAFMRALFDATPAGEDPNCWLIADHKSQRRWGLGWSRPFPFPLAPYRRNGYLRSGRTLAELAAQCGLDPATLTATVETFNAHATQGWDPDFKRGASRYNQVQGDSTHTPNAALGTLAKGPFHAVEIVPGSLGTFAGLASDENARVLDAKREPVPGLFAAGNDLSSIFAGHYPSGGITLGPGMTFGYIAAHVAAGRMGQTDTDQTMGQTAETASGATPEGDHHAAV